jgi:hypothetical protein
MPAQSGTLPDDRHCTEKYGVMGTQPLPQIGQTPQQPQQPSTQQRQAQQQPQWVQDRQRMYDSGIERTLRLCYEGVERI